MFSGMYPAGPASEAGTMTLYAEFVTTTSGAVGAFARKHPGISGVTRVSAGLYDITLEGNPVAILSTNVEAMTPTVDAAKGAGHASLVSRTLTGASPAVRVRFLRGDTAVAADVADGDTIIIKIIVKMSKV